jgi:hypothetical protein
LVRSASASGEVEMDTAAEREKETYLETASRPSRFQESQWGPEDVCTVLLEAMRVQWSHGYPHTPRGYPRTTHGFHEYPAGMQAAAADRILDVLPGDSLLDPFTGGGTSLVVGMTKGRRTVGIDVSPLAAFVATHRTWRPGVGAEAVTFEWMRATAARVVDGLDDAAKAVRDEDADAKAAKESETSGDDADGGREGAKKGGGSPEGVASGEAFARVRPRRPDRSDSLHRRVSAGARQPGRCGFASPSRCSARRRGGGRRSAGTRTNASEPRRISRLPSRRARRLKLRWSAPSLSRSAWMSTAIGWRNSVSTPRVQPPRRSSSTGTYGA